MLKVICKEDTSINDIRSIYLKKSKTDIGRLEKQITSGNRKSVDSIADVIKKKTSLKPSGVIQGGIPDGGLNKSSGTVPGKPEKTGEPG